MKRDDVSSKTTRRAIVADPPNVCRCDKDVFFPFVCEAFASGGTIVFTPRGRSMLPTLRNEKDLVVLTPTTETTPLKKYDVVFYRRATGQYAIHRIVAVVPGATPDGEDSFVICGDGQTRLEPGVKRRQILAVVSSFVRGRRRVDCERPSAFYRNYVRFWVATRPLRFVVVQSLRLVKRALKKALGKRASASK